MTLPEPPDALRTGRVRPTLDAPLGSPARPSWRGRLHQIALVVGLPLLVVLAIRADGARARAGVIVYAVGMCTMLVSSTTYHRFVQSLRKRTIWQRIDHAMIFAAIAGTFTPLTLVALGTGWAITMLVTVWGAGVLGGVLKFVKWRHANVIATSLYIAIGWAGLALVPALARVDGAAPVWLLFAGGVVYTIGAITFMLQWPKLRPSVFSYHEVWHSMTLGAAGVHFAAIWIVTS